MANPEYTTGTDTSADSGTQTAAASHSSADCGAQAAAPPVKAAEKSASISNAGAAAVVAPTLKRPADPQSEDDSKSKRAKSSDGDGASKKPGTRLWSEEDEMYILKGMVQHKEHYGCSKEFYTHITETLRNDVSKTQLSDKMRHLKTKYGEILEKIENREVLTTREEQVLDLSQKIWRGVSPSEEPKLIEKAQKKRKIKKKFKNDGYTAPQPHMPEQSKDVPHFVETLSFGNYDVMKKWLELVVESERAELKERWEKLLRAEFELYAEQCSLIHKQAKLVLQAHSEMV